MFRIDDATAATSLPVPEAAGTEGYWTEGNPATGVPATLERASWFNMIQEELRAIVVAGGITPSKTTYNQVLSAIKRIGQNTVVLADTGAANAYTAVNSVPLVVGTWVDGVVQAVKIAHTNTGASTYAPDGLPAIPIYGLGLQPLQGNELLLNGTAILMRMTIPGVNSGNPIAILMECAGGAQQVAPATQSQHAAQFAQLLSVTVPQCTLSYTNSTTVTLSRYRTGYVYSPGYGVVQVPSAGLTATAVGLTPNTLYYIYLNPNGGTPGLAVSTTTHVTDATGVEVMSGNNAYVLVGMAYALSATSWESTVRSWANDPGYSAITNLQSNSSTTSTTPANVNTGMITPFLLWAKEMPYISLTAGMSVSSANFSIASVVAVDNAVAPGAVASATPAAAGQVVGAATSQPIVGLVEGRHTTNMFGYVVGSVTGTWSGNAGTTSPTSLSVCISPHK